MSAKNLSKSTGFGLEWTERVVAVTSLVPYERNPRIITKAAFERLKASLRDMGYHQRIIVQPDLKAVGGHQRIRALQELGVESITVLVPNRELTIEEFRRLLVQDNLPFGDFDMDLLSEDFNRAELIDWGMSERMLDDFGKEPVVGFTDPNAVPLPVAHTISVSGQIWRCGGHRIGCGSSLDGSFVARLLGGEVPAVMVTDPPYGVEYDPQWRARAGLAGVVAGTALAGDDRADWGDAWALFPGAVAYVWHGGLHAAEVEKSLTDHRFLVRGQIVWVKTKAALSRGAYHWQHEPAYFAVRDGADDAWRFGEDHELAGYAVREGKTATWRGGRKQTTVWHIDGAQLDNGHATQKPIMCMQRPILNHTDEGGSCYDPFLGSGTTVIAAAEVRRRCFGIEINPVYVDIAVRRWQDFMGESAVDDTTGKEFNNFKPLAA